MIDKELCADDVRVAYPLFQVDCGGANPTSALSLLISKCNTKNACHLNKLWHSRLPYIHWSNVVRNTHSICFVAESANKYFAVAIWSSPVAQNRMRDGKKILELRRFAIAPDAPKNTASRMLSIMRKMICIAFPDIVKLISYQDTQVHKGTIYAAAGWLPVLIGKPADWTTSKRTRNKSQTLAQKIRWEKSL